MFFFFTFFQTSILGAKLCQIFLISHQLKWVMWIVAFIFKWVKFSDFHLMSALDHHYSPCTPCSDSSCTINNCQLLKCANDTALTERCINDDDYRNEVINLSEWCSNNYLKLNVSKTKILHLPQRCPAKMAYVLLCFSLLLIAGRQRCLSTKS